MCDSFEEATYQISIEVELETQRTKCHQSCHWSMKYFVYEWFATIVSKQLPHCLLPNAQDSSRFLNIHHDHHRPRAMHLPPTNTTVPTNVYFFPPEFALQVLCIRTALDPSLNPCFANSPGSISLVAVLKCFGNIVVDRPPPPPPPAWFNCRSFLASVASLSNISRTKSFITFIPVWEMPRLGCVWRIRYSSVMY